MISKRLKFCSWNIHGFKSRQFGVKLRDQDFLTTIKDVDFIGLTETHMHDETLEHLSIPGFHLLGYKNRKKNLKSNTASGGIAIFVRDNLIKLFTIIKSGNEDTVWVKIKKEFTGMGRDIFVCTCYFSPAKGANNSQVCARLEGDILDFQKKGHVIIMGDLNAKTGNQSDVIPPDKHDDDFHITCNETPPKRNSQDKTVNPRGIEILDLCKSLELYIANGRKVGDPFGKYTCFQWNGNSVVDYLITSASIFGKVSTLKVGDFIPWLSDHCPLLFMLEIQKSTDVPKGKLPTKEAPKQYMWKEGDSERFTEALSTPEFDEILTEILNANPANPNSIVNPLTEALLKAAEKAGVKRKTHVRSISSTDPPWFDFTCKQIKSAIKSVAKNVRRDPKNQDLKNELGKLKKQLKKTVKRKKKVYQEEILKKMNLNRKDGKQFWKLLEKIDHNESNEIFKVAVPDEKWVSHFKSVLQSTQSLTEGNEIPSNSAERGTLDYEISNEEILRASYVLRKGKAAGIDCVSNEMISCLLLVKPENLEKLFNTILSNPTIITKWHISMISPIHKKGIKSNPDNYRGISLLSCLGKLFTAILNLRLMKYVEENNILSKAQLGFLPGNRTSDAHLILYNLIDLYCNNRRKHLFGCFVDFSKAFDSIPRNTLFKKLLKHNINGKFYDCLSNLYTGDQACVKIGDRITDTFKANQGVKQGCILSPLLFNIFLSDLQPKLETMKNTPAEISPSKPLGCLIWADDLLLLSQTEAGLNNMLEVLNNFSKENGLSVNMDKTKVMIFNKTGRHIRRNFYLGEQKVETTREYKYLGFKITPSGEISSGLNDLKDRATKAFFKLKNKLGPLFQSHPETSIKLFETLIKPILLYCSDFWGALKIPKNNPFETLHHKICKQLLGVQRQTTNNGILLELGQVPLQLFAKKNAVKNWIRIADQGKANELAISSYNFSLLENLKWPTHLKNILSQIGLMEYFVSMEKANPAKVFERMYDIFHQEAFADITRENSKLRTYSLLKTNIGIEKYLTSDININTNDRIALTKFRISNHDLMIEKGRHRNLDKWERFCPFCPTLIENEIHFLLYCKTFRCLREELFTKICTYSPTFTPLPEKDKFVHLLNDELAIPYVGNFLRKAFECRSFLLGKHKNRE